MRHGDGGQDGLPAAKQPKEQLQSGRTEGPSRPGKGPEVLEGEPAASHGNQCQGRAGATRAEAEGRPRDEDIPR